MDPLALSLGIPGLFALGLSARFGWMAATGLGGKASAGIDRLPVLRFPDLPVRHISPIAIDGDLVRHDDGAYSAMWALEFPSGYFRDGFQVEDACNRFARLIAMKFPVGTLLQFRLKVDIDKGEKIQEFLDHRPQTRIHGPSRFLQDADLDHLAFLAEKNQFRRQSFYLWVRIPPTVEGQLTNFSLRQLRGSVAKGLTGLLHECRTGRIHQRDAVGEAKARETAAKTFQTVQSLLPFSSRRLNGSDLFTVLYLSLNRSQKTIPNPGPIDRPLDIRPYLARDEVTFENDCMMVGNVPFARVTVSTPPNPTILPDAFFNLTIDRNLHFPHTLVVEYVTLDQRKMIRKYDGRIRAIHRYARRITDKIEYSPEAKASLADLEQVRAQTTEPGNAVVQSRVYVLVEGPTIGADDRDLALAELSQRCDDVVASFHAIAKVDAHREMAGSAQFLLSKSLLGQADHRPTHSEIEELADSMACFLPLKDAWGGHRRPHFVCCTVSRRLMGINLFSTENTSSPLGLVIGGPGSGKSVLMAQLANSVLASVAGARVKAVDFGESFGALAEVCGGRHIRFTLGDVRAVNIWAYEGLSQGEEPDEQQIALVVNDLKYLARVPDHDVDAERVLQICVKAVYENEIPRIVRTGNLSFEPTLSHLLSVMRTYYFESARMTEICQTIRTRLLPYQNHPWLDAPTHPSYLQTSPFDVFELDSLLNFPRDIREAIASRVAAWVLRGIQKPDADGQRKPLLILFDEMHKLASNFPAVFRALETGARQGRTANVVTLLGTHSFQDLSHVAGLVSTAGTVILGKQNGEFEELAAQAALTPEAIEAVRQISNVPGERAQYVFSTGKGPEQRIEWIESRISPVGLWTYTTAPNERNARARVRALRPDWPMPAIVQWLAVRYPRGLDFEGQTELTLRDIDELQRGGR